MKDCLFCKIVNGTAPCYKIYEDDKTLAFLDIADDFVGHTLVIPKNHCTNILDADEETIKTVCQLLEVDPQLFESQDLRYGISHKVF